MIFRRRRTLVIKGCQWTRLSIILRYSFQGYGKSISLGKAIRGQQQYFFIKYLRTPGLLQPMIFLRKMHGISEMHLSVPNYTNLQKGIYETTEYLELFLRNLLLNEQNELQNRNLHISGLLNKEKSGHSRCESGHSRRKSGY